MVCTEMVFIDPLYNVPIEGNVNGLGSVRHPDFAMACGFEDPGTIERNSTPCYTHLN